MSPEHIFLDTLEYTQVEIGLKLTLVKDFEQIKQIEPGISCSLIIKIDFMWEDLYRDKPVYGD